ncbi:class I SAM-dependent methyltransferase [Streptomyces griseocarneus]|uniref:class I SAM-dependent methyltransferase n=1 Tax=Streptomyces griseocarneus TaxID=51201 RepID=UPI00167E43B9|nr:class I SAM-dependent methyltransferase [Streptomyces griseocarneus]MBZ6477456.1 class I SAM-dependent methyltransferase [Streptomyces griseocarneus]GHG49518.1 methyltransferase type 11 [Streptomyces griseocarneus]
MPPLRRRTPHDAVHHPLFARAYVRWSPVVDVRAGVAAHRRELLAGLSGRVIEIGAGNGLNFAHYPATVSEVVAIEPERLMRRQAVETAVRAGVPVDVVPGVAEALPVKSEAFDAAVTSLTLCSVRDVRRSLAELRRVLKPGGELRFFEHGLAQGRAAAGVQRALDRTVWPLLFGGCHTARDPLGAIEAAGFEVGVYRRLRVPAQGLASPASTCVLGVARRPAEPDRPSDP